jgi:hypothetical protein
MIIGELHPQNWVAQACHKGAQYSWNRSDPLGDDRFRLWLGLLVTYVFTNKVGQTPSTQPSRQHKL